MKKKIICIIPARGGSKRLPRKNIIDFQGKPIIAYTINAAIKTGLFDRVVVSTDDQEIANVSIKFGAEIDFRKKELATDDSRVVDVCLDFLNHETKSNNFYDMISCLYATAPLRNYNDIKSMINMVSDGRCKFAIAVTKFHYPPHQALKFDENCDITPFWPKLLLMNSNELPKLCVDNGSTYVMDVNEFIRLKSFYGQPLKGYLMPRERSVDIDTKSDLELARYYFSLIST